MIKKQGILKNDELSSEIVDTEESIIILDKKKSSKAYST